MLELSLLLVIIVVLVFPLLFRRIEENLEIFLFLMGIIAIFCSHFWGSSPVISSQLLKESLVEPIKITFAVLIAGLLFNRFRSHITRKLLKLEERIGPQFFGFLLIIALGVLSSVITAIIAALLLVEIISALKLDRKFEIRLTIIACFSIGLGAALTSIGEPLSTITVAKLRGAPYYANFLFFTKHLGAFIFPGIIGLGILGASLRGKEVTRNSLHQENR